MGARATVDADQAALTFSKQDYARYISLARSGAGTEQAAEKATSDIREKQDTLDHDTAALGVATKQVDVLGTQLAQARAMLAGKQAALRQARLNVGYTTITSPVDGTIAARSLRVGQCVQAGTQLMAVVPMKAVYVTANYKETQLTNVHAGQPVIVDVDTFPATSCTAPWTASRLQAARNSRCCRRTTQQATSPRSSSACRSKSRSTRMIR